MARGFHTTIVYNHYAKIADKQAALLKAGMRTLMYEARREAKKVLVPGHGYDTGNLYKSILFRNVEGLVYELYTNMDYAVYVEYGTEKMAAMPFLMPAGKATAAKVQTMAGAILSGTGV